MLSGRSWTPRRKCIIGITYTAVILTTFASGSILFLSSFVDTNVSKWGQSLFSQEGQHLLRKPLPRRGQHSAVHNAPSQKLLKRLPQALIIGAKKCGTRALLEYLKIHPDVVSPGPEIHFFDNNFEKGLDWYRSQMPLSNNHQVTIEKSPAYLITESAPQRVFAMNNQTKLIVILRDPVIRAISDYAQAAVVKQNRIKPFEKLAMMMKFPKKSNAGDFHHNSRKMVVNERWPAIRIGRYINHIQNWLKYFPLSQFHFVSGENLIRDPASEIGPVQDFLSLPSFVGKDNFYFNSTKGFPCFIRSEHSQPECLGSTKGRKHPEIDPSVLHKLYSYYKPYNNHLTEVIGKDFRWGES